jgi:mannose-6-phosphate isomerase-like protein (cupin superfamily)
MNMTQVIVSAALAAVLGSASLMAATQGEKNEVTVLDTILRNNPLPPGGPNASIVASFRAGDSELGILVMRRNELHHHDRQDHVLYLARGTGIAQLENAAGEIETRAINPGDILKLPRGKKHGFRKTSSEDLVFLVVAGPGADAIDDTVIDQ